MSVPTPSSTSRLLASIKTINNIDDERFTILFHKVLQGFCRTESTETCLFAPDEKDYLKKTLSLEDSTLDGMLSTLELIVKEASFYLMKPAVLANYLKELGLSEERCMLISKLWSTNAKSVIDVLKKELCCNTKVLDIETSLHLQLSSNRGGQTKLPLALLHLNVKSAGSELKSPMTLEFTHDELSEFYQILETIQNNLDDLV